MLPVFTVVFTFVSALSETGVPLGAPKFPYLVVRRRHYYGIRYQYACIDISMIRAYLIVAVALIPLAVVIGALVRTEAIYIGFQFLQYYLLSLVLFVGIDVLYRGVRFKKRILIEQIQVVDKEIYRVSFYQVKGRLQHLFVEDYTAQDALAKFLERLSNFGYPGDKEKYDVINISYHFVRPHHGQSSSEHN
jgi:hypothetical protein